MAVLYAQVVDATTGFSLGAASWCGDTREAPASCAGVGYDDSFCLSLRTGTCLEGRYKISTDGWQLFEYLQELGPAGQHPCDVLSFNDKYMMLYRDRRFVTLRGGTKSCIPHELWDRDFYKYSSSRCLYCNGHYDGYVQRQLGRAVVRGVTAVARWTASKRAVQQKLPFWKVQKKVCRRLGEADGKFISEKVAGQV